MADKKPEKKKRRTREHIIADLSISHTERQALLAGFAVQRIVRDYGIDLFIATYDRFGEVENGEIRIQLKATDTPTRVDGPYVVYKHESSSALQAFRSHRRAEQIDPMTLASVRKTLVGFGFMEEKEFEEAVQETAAERKAKRE